MSSRPRNRGKGPNEGAIQDETSLIPLGKAKAPGGPTRDAPPTSRPAAAPEHAKPEAERHAAPSGGVGGLTPDWLAEIRAAQKEDPERAVQLLITLVRTLRDVFHRPPPASSKDPRTRAAPHTFEALCLIAVAKATPELIRAPPVTEALAGQLRRAATNNVKTRTDPRIPLICIAVLEHAWAEAPQWPTVLVDVMLEDAAGERLWIDLPQAARFVANISTAFERVPAAGRATPAAPASSSQRTTPAPPASAAEEEVIEESIEEGGFAPSDAAMKANTTTSGGDVVMEEVFEEAIGGGVSAPPAVPSGHTHPAAAPLQPPARDARASPFQMHRMASPLREDPPPMTAALPTEGVRARYAGEAPAVKALVQRALDGLVARASEVVAKHAVRLLTQLVAYPEARQVAARELEPWLANPTLAVLARELAMALCAAVTPSVPQDAAVVVSLASLRTKNTQFFIDCMHRLAAASPTYPALVLREVCTSELAALRAIGTGATALNTSASFNAVLTSAVSAVESDMPEQVLAEVMLDATLSTNAGNRMAVRHLMRRAVKLCVTVRPVNFVSLCRGLWMNRPELHSAAPAIVQRWTQELADLVTLAQLLAVPSAHPDGAPITHMSASQVEATQRLWTQVAQIQADALWWVANVMPRHAPLGPRPFTAMLRQLLFVAPPNTYLTNEVAGDGDRAMIRALTGALPVYESTLSALCHLALNRFPVAPLDALDIVEAVVRRAGAATGLPGLNPLLATNPQLVDELLSLAVYRVPTLQMSNYPPMAVSAFYWQAALILVILAGYNPGTIGRRLWQSYPSIKVLMEMVIMRRTRFPPIPGGHEIEIDRLLHARECAVTLDIESALATEAQGLRVRITEKNSQLLSQMMSFDPTGAVRVPPPTTLSLVEAAGDRFHLGRALCASRNPDLLLDLMSRLTASGDAYGASLSWLGPVIESDATTLDVLPPACVCDLLLAAISDHRTAAPTQQPPTPTAAASHPPTPTLQAASFAGPGASPAMGRPQSAGFAAVTAPPSGEMQLHSVSSIVLTKIASILESSNESATLEILSHLLTRLSSKDAAIRAAAKRCLSLIMASRASGGAFSASLLSAPTAAADTAQWLEAIANLRHASAAAETAIGAIGAALVVETVQADAEAYLVFLASHGPDASKGRVSQMASSAATLLATRPVMAARLLASRAHSTLLARVIVEALPGPRDPPTPDSDHIVAGALELLALAGHLGDAEVYNKLMARVFPQGQPPLAQLHVAQAKRLLRAGITPAIAPAVQALPLADLLSVLASPALPQASLLAVLAATDAQLAAPDVKLPLQPEAVRVLATCLTMWAGKGVIQPNGTTLRACQRWSTAPGGGNEARILQRVPTLLVSTPSVAPAAPITPTKFDAAGAEKLLDQALRGTGAAGNLALRSLLLALGAESRAPFTCTEHIVRALSKASGKLPAGALVGRAGLTLLATLANHTTRHHAALSGDVSAALLHVIKGAHDGCGEARVKGTLRGLLEKCQGVLREAPANTLTLNGVVVPVTDEPSSVPAVSSTLADPINAECALMRCIAAAVSSHDPETVHKTLGEIASALDHCSEAIGRLLVDAIFALDPSLSTNVGREVFLRLLLPRGVARGWSSTAATAVLHGVSWRDLTSRVESLLAAPREGVNVTAALDFIAGVARHPRSWGAFIASEREPFVASHMPLGSSSICALADMLATELTMHPGAPMPDVTMEHHPLEGADHMEITPTTTTTSTAAAPSEITLLPPARVPLLLAVARGSDHRVTQLGYHLLRRCGETRNNQAAYGSYLAVWTELYLAFPALATIGTPLTGPAAIGSSVWHSSPLDGAIQAAMTRLWTGVDDSASFVILRRLAAVHGPLMLRHLPSLSVLVNGRVADLSLGGAIENEGSSRHGPALRVLEHVIGIADALKPDVFESAELMPVLKPLVQFILTPRARDVPRLVSRTVDLLCFYAAHQTRDTAGRKGVAALIGYLDGFRALAQNVPDVRKTQLLIDLLSGEAPRGVPPVTLKQQETTRWNVLLWLGYERDPLTVNADKVAQEVWDTVLAGMDVLEKASAYSPLSLAPVFDALLTCLLAPHNTVRDLAYRLSLRHLHASPRDTQGLASIMVTCLKHKDAAIVKAAVYNSPLLLPFCLESAPEVLAALFRLGPTGQTAVRAVFKNTGQHFSRA